jgi:hypothetical protein
MGRVEGGSYGREIAGSLRKASWQKLVNDFVIFHEQGKTRRVTKYQCPCLAHLSETIMGAPWARPVSSSRDA